MAGRKDKAVVAVIKGLTDSQASRLIGDIVKAKNKYAGHAQGTASVCSEERIGRFLQKGCYKRLEGKKNG